VVLDAVRTFRDQGRTVVVVAHRASLVRAADDVVEVRSAPHEATAVREARRDEEPTLLEPAGATTEGRHP
jgi:ATP-binding cassette subfamily C protein CydD